MSFATSVTNIKKRKIEEYQYILHYKFENNKRFELFNEN